MKISSISSCVLLYLMVGALGDSRRKCCAIEKSIVQKNTTFSCVPQTGRRVQTNFLKNDFVLEGEKGSCVDILGDNETFIFDVNDQGLIQMKERIKVDFYPKCCHLGHVYNEKLHSCQVSKNTSVLENGIPPNSFISVGLPNCEVIRDVSISTLEEIEWTSSKLKVKTEGRSFEEGEFCLDAAAFDSFVVRVCEDRDVCEKVRCIRKCCQDGQSFVNGSKCKDTFRYGVDLRASSKIAEPDAPFAIVHGMARPIYILKDSKNFNIDEMGTFSVYSNISESVNFYKPFEQSYCIEHAYKKGRLDGYTLFSRALKPQLQIKFAVTRWIKILSCFFLFLTMVVYLMLPKMLNLFGKILLSYSFATFLFFFFLCLSQFLSTEYNDLVCKIMGFLTIMASFWSFTWLHIMCIDIWVSFGTPRTFSGPLQRNELKKLVQYSIYGWGVPFVWILVIVLFNVTTILPKSLHPYVGYKKCYMENTGDQPGNYAYNLFITLPVLLQQIANIVLFVKTLIYCLKIRGDIQRMNESSKKNYRVGREELNLVMKLAVIMGVSFLFETISSMFDFSKNSVARNIEVAGDTINCLQGVFIFVVFICKRKIFDSLLERWKGRKPCKFEFSSSMATQESLHTISTKRGTMSSH